MIRPSSNGLINGSPQKCKPVDIVFFVRKKYIRPFKQLMTLGQEPGSDEIDNLATTGKSGHV